MAFTFANMAGGGQSGGGATVRDGPELQEITTDQLGFTGLHPEAETQIRLIPEPWPADALPPPSASLLSVASSRGVIAAAGPNHLVIATTASVRDALRTADEKKIEKIRPFQPQVSISKPRLGHVAFASNDAVLVITSQDGGGLEAYQLEDLLNGQTRPAQQVSTNGAAIRALVPNPAPDSWALFAAVTNDGDLLLADLQAGNLRNGANGPVLRSGVSCVSWSNKGKQLVAGTANGAAVQMKPDGSVVADIPKSTSIPDGYHVSGICWLENDSFFIIYTPNDTTQGVMPSEYCIVTRRPKSQDFTFQKLPEVVPAFGMKRIPTFHFITRLRTFPPHIQDLLLVSATSSSDIGLISKADKPLSNGNPVTGEFTLTLIGNDGRRAELPISQDNQLDTSSIGMALDLSSKDPVPRPIPSDPEIEVTTGPCPNILVLNNEGILLSWWLIYDDSVKAKTLFSGFETLASSSQHLSQPVNAATPPSQTEAVPSSTFGPSGFAGAKPFASASSAFGAPTPQSSIGNASGSAFGQSSAIGNAKSSWASTGFSNTSTSQSGGSGFGQPAFGSASALGGGSAPAFGTAQALGSNTAPGFGSASALGSNPTFGQPTSTSSALGKPSFGTGSSTFGSNPSAATPLGANASQSSGFASFSNKGGFGGTAQEGNFSSPFAKASGESAFGNPASGSSFSGFGGSGSNTNNNAFGNTGGFKLQSSFKGDGTAQDDLPKPSQPSGFEFAVGLDDILGESAKVTSPTHDKEEDMDEGEVADDSESDKAEKTTFSGFGTQQPPKLPPQTLVTPPSTLGQPKATPAPPVSSLFGSSNTQSTTPAATTSTGFSFGGLRTTTPKDTPAPLPSTTPKDTPLPPSKAMFGTTPQSETTPAAVQKSQPNSLFSNIPKLAPESTKVESKAPQIKQEPPSDDEAVDLGNIPPAPLPPDTMSKPRYVSGDTSASSNNSKTSAGLPDEAPLPPDFLPAKRSAASKAEEHGPPSEDDSALSDGFEGSGEDVEEEASPIGEPTKGGLDVPSEGHDEQVQTSPESSFKSGEQSPETSPTGGLFTKVSTNASQKPMRPLFGEVGTTGPILPPPKPHESPRSPSPVRRLLPAAEALRTESARSVSAPAHGRASPSIIDRRRAEAATAAAQSQSKLAEEMAKQKSHQAALVQQKAKEAARELEDLEDHEDERLRKELEAPISPSETLPQFVTYQSKPVEARSKSGVPAQIEHLYQDINCMIDTLGMNARALTAYMQYQRGQELNEDWPTVLNSETPMDALSDEWVLGDISRLREGQEFLDARLKANQIDDVASKLQQCQALLGQDVVELKTKLTSIRKTLHAKHTSEAALASSLSAEQASVQQDLRKASASVHSRLGQVEDSLSILRAKLAEAGAIESEPKRTSVFGRSSSQKKPTVEAVMNTITKMTNMAEKKSADIDVLEAQLRKLNVSNKSGIRNGADSLNGTPKRAQKPLTASTPGSSRSSVYHTPDSKFGASVRSTPGRKGVNGNGMMMIATEDREMWQAKARRKKEAAAVLRTVIG